MQLEQQSRARADARTGVPQYQSSTLNAQFAASQVVTVYVNDSKSGDNCTPLSLGGFTTQ